MVTDLLVIVPKIFAFLFFTSCGHLHGWLWGVELTQEGKNKAVYPKLHCGVTRLGKKSAITILKIGYLSFYSLSDWVSSSVTSIGITTVNVLSETLHPKVSKKINIHPQKNISIGENK